MTNKKTVDEKPVTKKAPVKRNVPNGTKPKKRKTPVKSPKEKRMGQLFIDESKYDWNIVMDFLENVINGDTRWTAAKKAGVIYSNLKNWDRYEPKVKDVMKAAKEIAHGNLWQKVLDGEYQTGGGIAMLKMHFNEIEYAEKRKLDIKERELKSREDGTIKDQNFTFTLKQRDDLTQVKEEKKEK